MLREMAAEDMAEVKGHFAQAARRARKAGFDMLELNVIFGSGGSNRTPREADMAQHAAPPGTTVYHVVDVDSFPAQVETRGSRFLGGFSVFLGVSLAVLPAIGLGAAVLKNGWSPDLKDATLWFSPMAVLGVWLLWWGINQWMQRLTILIDGDQVLRRSRSIRGVTEDTEPLRAFEGLRGLDRWTSTYGDLWELLLQHRDPAKTVVFYRPRITRGHR